MGTNFFDEKSPPNINSSHFIGNLPLNSEQILCDAEERKENLEANLSLLIRAQRTADIYKFVDAIGKDESALDIARFKSLVAESIVKVQSEVQKLVEQKLAQERNYKNNEKQMSKKTLLKEESSQSTKKTQVSSKVSKKRAVNTATVPPVSVKCISTDVKTKCQGVRRQLENFLSSHQRSILSLPHIYSENSVPSGYRHLYLQHLNHPLEKSIHKQLLLPSQKNFTGSHKLSSKMPKNKNKPHSQMDKHKTDFIDKSSLYCSSAVPLAPPCRTRIVEDEESDELRHSSFSVNLEPNSASHKLIDASVETKNQATKELCFQQLPGITIESKKYPINENVKIVTFKKTSFNEDDPAVSSGYQSYSNVPKDFNPQTHIESVDKNFSSALGKNVCISSRSEPELISKVIGKVYSSKNKDFRKENADENSNSIDKRIMKKLIVQAVKENIKDLETSNDVEFHVQEEVTECSVNDSEQNFKSKEQADIRSPSSSAAGEMLSHMSENIKTPSRTPSPILVENTLPKSPSFSDSETEEIFKNRGDHTIPKLATPDLTPPASPNLKEVLTPFTSNSSDPLLENNAAQENSLLQKFVQDESTQMSPHLSVKNINSESTLTTASEEVDNLSEGECYLHRSLNKAFLKISSNSLLNQIDNQNSNITILDLQTLEQEQMLKSNGMDHQLSEGEIPSTYIRYSHDKVIETGQNDISNYKYSSDEVSEISEGQLNQNPSDKHSSQVIDKLAKSGVSYTPIVHPSIDSRIIKMDKSFSEGEVTDAGTFDEQNKDRQTKVATYEGNPFPYSQNPPSDRTVHHSRLYFHPSIISEHKTLHTKEQKHFRTSLNEIKFKQLSLNKVPAQDTSSSVSEGQTQEE